MKLKIINGPPCSGKTTYVEKHIKENDIVYDYDRLYKALTYNTKHFESDVDFSHAHQFIIDFRLLILNRLKETENKGLENVWFIVSNLTDDFKKYVKDLNPEYIKMNKTKEECLKLLDGDDNRPNKEYWKSKINKWFEKHEKEGEKLEKGKRKLKQRQYRAMEFDLNPTQEKKNIFDSGYYIEGYATTFQPYLFSEDQDGPIYEHFTKEAFQGCDMTDVIFQFNHEGKVHARLSNNTMKLEIDDHGLKVYADLSKSTAGRELFEEIQNGLITKMSWGFRLGEYEYDKDTRTIVHTKVKKIYDVSAVSIPANNDTEIYSRAFVDGVIDKAVEESREIERLKLLIDLNMEEMK